MIYSESSWVEYSAVVEVGNSNFSTALVEAANLVTSFFLATFEGADIASDLKAAIEEAS